MGKLIKIKSGIFTFYFDNRRNIFYEYNSQKYLICRKGLYKLSNGDYIKFIDAIYRNKLTDHDSLFKMFTDDITCCYSGRDLK